jgi:Icc-related predicted phosphoesterase
VKKFYDYYKPGMLDDTDLIIGCGDLPRDYLEFLVTMAHCPLIYVHGNHDDVYATDPPGGCECIDDRIYEYKGVRFLGLGGSYKYRPDGKYMYTEREMERRILRQRLSLFRKKGFDVLVTHAAAWGITDMDSPVHRGFKCFLPLMEKYSPQYMVHGHVHRSYGYNLPVLSSYKDTTIINAFGYYFFEI